MADTIAEMVDDKFTADQRVEIFASLFTQSVWFAKGEKPRNIVILLSDEENNNGPLLTVDVNVETVSKH